MTDADPTRIVSEAGRAQRLADNRDIDANRDLGALAWELRRAQALVAALDDRIG